MFFEYSDKRYNDLYYKRLSISRIIFFIFLCLTIISNILMLFSDLMMEAIIVFLGIELLFVFLPIIYSFFILKCLKARNTFYYVDYDSNFIEMIFVPRPSVDISLFKKILFFITLNDKYLKNSYFDDEKNDIIDNIKNKVICLDDISHVNYFKISKESLVVLVNVVRKIVSVIERDDMVVVKYVDENNIENTMEIFKCYGNLDDMLVFLNSNL